MSWTDRRTPEQRRTHTVLVAARDRFMGKWGEGKAAGGSTAVYACRPEDEEAVLQWVRGREEFTYVRVTTEGNLRRLKGLVTIYLIWQGHQALQGGGGTKCQD